MECCVQRLYAIAKYKHESWTGPQSQGYDIAVLELNLPLNLALPAFPKRNVKFSSGQELTAIGWGQTGLVDQPRYLQMANDLVYLSPQECGELLGHVTNDRELCAGSPDQTQDTCDG